MGFRGFASWYRNRYVWVAVVLLISFGAVVVTRSAGREAEPEGLQAQIETRMRTTLEQSKPEQHNHTGHGGQQVATDADAKPAVICGVRVYGYEPAEVTVLADVRKVYGFHLCGVAEKKRAWDGAVKLAGPVIVDMSTQPAGIQVVEATEDVRYIDRLWQMFPAKYAELATKEALPESELADLRRRYDDAADL
jgi:hypothetical protein